LQTTLLASQGELLFSSAQGLTELAVPLILLALKGYPALALEERAKEWFGQDRNPVRPSVLSFPGIVDRGWSWFRGEDSRQAAVKVVVGFGLCAQGAMTLTNSYLKYKTSKTLLKFIQLKLKVVAEFVAALQELEELIKNSPALQESFDGLDDLNETLHTWRELSPEFNKFMSYLNTDTFKSDFSILSNAGRILASYFLMAQHKAKLLPGLRALGRMDAYLSCAHLFNEGKDRDNTWSFVNLVESPTPCFKAQDCWNPFFDHTKAVSNSLCVGFDGFPKSAIITGPNAGGKSSNIKSMGIMLLLGQSIGIVPGQLTCTPFAKIVTHMNIVDDMAEGKSHFVASVIDTRRPVKIVKSASPGEFIAIITDEMFNDTRREEGQAAAFSLVELLGKHPQTICLSATHFPLLTELEQMYPQLFKNYKVSVNYEQGKIIYPFKLEPGISHQNVAFDILRQEGFDDEFLARAREVIAWEKN
jgi:DNA mismatch repair ATPase MutS